LASPTVRRTAGSGLPEPRATVLDLKAASEPKSPLPVKDSASPQPARSGLVARAPDGKEKIGRTVKLGSGLEVRLGGDPGPFRVELKGRTIEKGLEEVSIELTSKEPAAPPKLTLEWEQPLVESAALWRTSANRDKRHFDGMIKADAVTSKATSEAPVISLVGPDGSNRLTFAWSDALNVSHLKSFVVEETGELGCQVGMFDGDPAPAKKWTGTLRIDRRERRYEEALADVSHWWAKQPGYEPSSVPEAAKLPWYSTWYSFHQKLTDPKGSFEALDKQCREAYALGCQGVLIDDGWQLSPEEQQKNARGYASCGDWVAPNAEEFKAFVDKQHERGKSVITWIAPPFAGDDSKALEKFQDKLLYEMDEPWNCGVLDPRYPEVRDYLIETCERLMKESGVDGFKIDFVDRFLMKEGTPEGKADGRDYASVSEAVDRLFGDLMQRLQEIKPDAMIEFRRPYSGPLMRKYGNMFRARDCPVDHVQNRLQVVDTRLLAGDTAVHCDMLMWHPDEPVESAALQVLSGLFSVQQISVKIDELPKSHQKMLAFWLDFSRKHRDVLLDGKLSAESPELNYPLVSSRTKDEQVIAAYEDRVVKVAADAPKTVHLVNATQDDRLVLDLEGDLGKRTVKVHDAEGTVVREELVAFGKGVQAIDVPPGGLATLETPEVRKIGPSDPAKKPVRVAVIGYGSMAEKHVSAMRELGGVELVGVSGRSLDGAKAFGGQHDIPPFESYEKMLDEAKPDAVFILVPPSAHGPIEKAVLKRGIPFFVEKPLSVNWQQAKKIAEQVEKKGLTTAVGYHWNYLDSMDRAKSLLEDRQVVSIDGYWLTKRPPPPWWSKKSESGGQLIEQLTHLFDAARKLAGEADKVSGDTQHVEAAKAPDGADVPEVSTARVQFEKGVVGLFRGNIVMPKSHKVGLDVVLDDGTKLEITQDKLVVTQGDDKKVFENESNPTVREDHAFLEAVRTGDDSQIRSTYLDALRSHRIATRAAESADKGGKALSAVVTRKDKP
jgi:alpha-galactosidase